LLGLWPGKRFADRLGLRQLLADRHLAEQRHADDQLGGRPYVQWPFGEVNGAQPSRRAGGCRLEGQRSPGGRGDRGANRSIADSPGLTQKTLEGMTGTIFAKLDLEDDPDINRRVLAVLMYICTARRTGP
jgi:hypothetical protein